MDEDDVSSLVLLGTAFGLLIMAIAVAMSVLSDAIGSFYARRVIGLGAVVILSIAASLVTFTLKKRLIAWRCFWLAGSLFASFLLWFYSPSVLLDRAIRTSREFHEPTHLPAGLPDTPKHREEVLYSEMLVDIHQTESEYESALRELNPKRESIPI